MESIYTLNVYNNCNEKKLLEYLSFSSKENVMREFERIGKNKTIKVEGYYEVWKSTDDGDGRFMPDDLIATKALTSE